MKKTFSKKIAKIFGSVERINLSLHQLSNQTNFQTSILPFMNRSIIFRNAWTSARNLATVKGGTARQYIADALRKAWKGIVVTVESLTVAPAAEQIQKLADALVFAYNQYYMTPKKQEAMALVRQASENLEGFAKTVAESVFLYKKCSPKQAYCIARGIHDNCGNAGRYADFIYQA